MSQNLKEAWIEMERQTEHAAPTAGATAGRSGTPRAWRRPKVNITPLERWGRIIVGAIGVAAGAWLLTSATGVVVIGLEILLILAGLDLIVTGALGHCPLYSKLGYMPRSLRRSA